MILEYPSIPLKWTKKGKIHNICKRKNPRITIKCEKCGKIETIDVNVFEKRISLLKNYKNINEHLCGVCSRPYMSSIGGLKGAYDENGNLKPNKGRFTTERVKNMSEEEYKIFCEQRKRAAEIFHKRLKENPELRKKHFEKVFKNSKIGYISKGQQILYELLKDEGFELEKIVEGMKCDLVNFDKKVIIEYYGDFFHCNPKFWNPEDYNSVIGLKAKEKWKKDREKNFRLRGLGWQVIVIWEYELINEKEKLLKKLESFKSKEWNLEKWWEFNKTKTCWVHKKNERKNYQILTKDINIYLEKGFCKGKNEDFEDIKLQRVWIYNDEKEKNKCVLLSELDNYTKKGWKKGRKNFPKT